MSDDLSEFIKDIEKLDQNSLVTLFFDWFDWYNEYPQESTLKRLYELRKRINVHTTTGVKEWGFDSDA
jgi:hypothetical protein